MPVSAARSWRFNDLAGTTLNYVNDTRNTNGTEIRTVLRVDEQGRERIRRGRILPKEETVWIDRNRLPGHPIATITEKLTETVSESSSNSIIVRVIGIICLV